MNREDGVRHSPTCRGPRRRQLRGDRNWDGGPGDREGEPPASPPLPIKYSSARWAGRSGPPGSGDVTSLLQGEEALSVGGTTERLRNRDGGTWMLLFYYMKNKKCYPCKTL